MRLLFLYYFCEHYHQAQWLDTTAMQSMAGVFNISSNKCVYRPTILPKNNNTYQYIIIMIIVMRVIFCDHPKGYICRPMCKNCLYKMISSERDV